MSVLLCGIPNNDGRNFLMAMAIQATAPSTDPETDTANSVLKHGIAKAATIKTIVAMVAQVVAILSINLTDQARYKVNRSPSDTCTSGVDDLIDPLTA